jgi:hypothetical protein
MSIGTSLFSGGLLYTMLSSRLRCLAGCLLACAARFLAFYAASSCSYASCYYRDSSVTVRL